MENIENIESIENTERETNFTIEEPHYPYSHEQEEQFHEEEHMLPIYSPQQLCLLKKPSHMQEISLDGYEYVLDVPMQRDPSRKDTRLKKVCIHKADDNCTTAEQSASYPMEYEIEGDLERLVHMIKQESQKKFIFPKTFPLPSCNEVESHLNNLKMRFTPSGKQEDFLSNYIKQDDLLRIKIGLTDEVLNDEETMKFEDWVDQLCSSANHQSLKEMARRQKVKRYLEKKHNRTYEKKVHYHIRQKVAEERLRVKGRFVTWSQALKMLNEVPDNKKQWSYNDYFKIKNLLNEKFGAVKSERSIRNH